MSNGVYKKILVNEDEFNDLGVYCKKMSSSLQTMVDDYLILMQKIRDGAVKKGDPATALDSFILYGAKLKNVIEDSGNLIEDYSDEYVDEIAEKDNFSFDDSTFPFPFG